jgi:hypothetical protein
VLDNQIFRILTPGGTSWVLCVFSNAFSGSALNFASQISKQSGLVVTRGTRGIFVRSAVIVCVLDMLPLMQFVGVDILANCVLISVLLVWHYFLLFTVFRYCGVVCL